MYSGACYLIRRFSSILRAQFQKNHFEKTFESCGSKNQKQRTRLCVLVHKWKMDVTISSLESQFSTHIGLKQ